MLRSWIHWRAHTMLEPPIGRESIGNGGNMTRRLNSRDVEQLRQSKSPVTQSQCLWQLAHPRFSRKLEENDESYFNEEFNVWLSDEPLTNEEICRLMRGVERERKLEGKPPLVQFLPRSKRTKKTPKKARESTPAAK
jgi:hypothetical protein